MTDARYRFYGRTPPQQTGTRPPFRVEIPAQVEGGDDAVAVFRLYDPIDSWGGWWGISAKEFVAALDELDDKVTEIQLRVNSPGGEVYEGITILNALRNHSARVVAHVDGLAASAASFILMGADEVVMGRNTELMIHDAWGICVGPAADMHKLGDDLDRLSNNIASIYAEKAGGDVEAWRSAMTDETWYSADEAVEAGLADRVEAAADDGDGASNRFDLSIFAHAGRRNAPTPVMPAAKSPAAKPADPSPKKEGAEMDFGILVQGIRDWLGVSDDVELDAAGLLAKFQEQVANLTDPTPAPAAQVPDGMVLVDEGTLAALKASAEKGEKAHNRQQKDDRERLVKAAISDGRIPKAREQYWLDYLEADPGATATLEAMPKGLIPVEAIGVAGQPDASSDDALYASLYGSEA